MTLAQHPGREIRSYVLRQGRLSQAQKRALEEDLPQFLFARDHCSAPQTVFDCPQPLTLEIGFGNGESLLEMAKQSPELNFLGFEVHGPGMGHLLLGIKRFELRNVRVSQSDAVDFLRALPEASLQRIQIFFPDPWHKKKHHKRRIVNADLLGLAARVLEPEGVLHVATDWQPYAEEIQTIFEADQRFSVVEAPQRPETKYERRGRRLNHVITDLAIQRC
ncbi:MAG: tRNA (guanosine(46)-N7)-methyltransferase TrmB [Pseudomonadales bacterium]|jgi:tRNA (guanine-N7-)-methyltransferase